MRHVPAFLSRHGAFLTVWTGLFLVFLLPLVTLRAGFTLGDYAAQFYPWSFAYAEALKKGSLLLWTPLIQCGFPLFAEGQTGMLYPLNLLLFGALPFQTAYNAMFLAHFAMGGVFMYLFCLKRGQSGAGAAVASLAFTFGSAYAGCFYNIVTMRSLVWFPLALCWVESYRERRSSFFVFALGLTLAQAWLAGFPQTAAYACLFTLLYGALRMKGMPGPGGGAFLAGLSGALALSVFIAVPQLWATLDLAGHSTRTLQEKTFILWGSVPPWGPVTLFLSPWNAFAGASLYIGLMPFLLLLHRPLEPSKRVLWVLAVLAYLLSLGAFNPFYWILLQVPMASLLRNPAKFLFFAAFFLSVLAGHAFDGLARDFGTAGALRVYVRRAARLSAAFLGVAFGAALMARVGAPLLKRAARLYVEHFVLNKSYHRWDASVYYERIDSILRLIAERTDPLRVFFWVPFFFAGLWVLMCALGPQRIRKGMFGALFFLALFADLFLYGWFRYGVGFVGNVGPFPDTARTQAYPRDGRWLDAVSEEASVFPANQNLLTAHASVGAYSPLLDRDYYGRVKDLGVLDDSFGKVPLSKDYADKNRALIDFLGIRYLAVPGGMTLEGYEPLSRRAGRRLYRNPAARPEFTLTEESGLPWETERRAPEDTFQILKEGPMALSLSVETQKGARLVRSQVFDRGWRATVDGEPRTLEKAGGAFQALRLEPGRHEVEFVFKPDSFIIGRWFYLGGILLAAAGMLVTRKKGG